MKATLSSNQSVIVILQWLPRMCLCLKISLSCALKFPRSQLSSDDCQTLEIADVFHYYLSFQQTKIKRDKEKDKKLQKGHCYSVKVYGV